MNISLNHDQSLYVLTHDGYVTTCGFESLFKETNELAKRLKKPELAVSQDYFGTALVYEKHQTLLTMAKDVDLGFWFHSDTPGAVKRILKCAHKNKETLRLFYGDIMTGADWLEENDVIGKVGRSTGTLKIPLLIQDNEIGGGSILDHCIVKIVNASTGDVLYSHHNYHRGIFTAIECDEHDYEAAVLVDGKLHARLHTMDDAYHWIAFMVGKSFLSFN